MIKGWFEFPIRNETGAKDKIIVAGRLLLLHANDANWSIVWPVFQNDKEIGREIVKHIVSSERFAPTIARKLNEDGLANFYIWLVSELQPSKDPARIRAYRVTTEHETADFRDGMLNELTGRGTEESYRQLQRIQEVLGIGLDYYLDLAGHRIRQNTWTPISPEQLGQLLQDQQTRWIQSGSQLLDVLIELLSKLEDELQGLNNATPSAIDLWNEPKPKEKLYTPKDEERLSDYIERFQNRENYKGKMSS
ncbi:MAG: hypothetical protein IPL78_18340 [Chloroflexi bacterium]|nr:hypothetical protein [Chloroflexota bacterium]